MGLFVKSQYYMQYGGPIITFKRLHIFFSIIWSFILWLCHSKSMKSRSPFLKPQLVQNSYFIELTKNES